jgi:hypothetical protein
MCKYKIVSSDLENLTRMNPGRYRLSKIDAQQQKVELDISEIVVSDSLHAAITRLNSTLGSINGFLEASRPPLPIVRRFSLLIKRGRDIGKEQKLSIPGIRAAGTLTYHEASVNGTILAVAYKIDGRKITRSDLIRNLASDLRKLGTTINNVETIVRAFEGRRASDRLRKSLPGLRSTLDEIAVQATQAEHIKTVMESKLSGPVDEPVVHVLYSSSSGPSANILWYPYESWYSSADNVLFIEAPRKQVDRVTWVTKDTMEVFFQGSGVKYFCSPLRPVSESEQLDELKENDQALLVGRYIAVVQAHQGQAEEIVNWLRLTGVQEVTVSRRRMNRMNKREVAVERYRFR